MKNEVILISILLTLLLAPLVLAEPREVYGVVTYVVDGDTIHVQIQGYDERVGNITVRLADVDSPEMNTPGGHGSRNCTYQALNGKFVYLDLDDVTGKDRYCRWVAVVYLQEQNGTLTNFNKMRVDSGCACICNFTNNEFDPHTWWNGTYPSSICIKGSPCNSIPEPCSDDSIVGSTSSRKWHYSCCQWAKEINPANLIRFNSTQDARNQGYVPCKVCNPP
jgi:micrococcal nuclease